MLFEGGSLYRKWLKDLVHFQNKTLDHQEEINQSLLLPSPFSEQGIIGTQWWLQRECDGLCMQCLYLLIYSSVVQGTYSAPTKLGVWTWCMKLELWEYGCMTVACVTAVSHHLICSQMYVSVCVCFSYLPLLICRGEWRRWSDVSGLSGERDRPRPWDRLEWSDVSECISEMSAEFKSNVH